MNMKVVCVLLGALVAVAHGQAYVSYYGQDLHHPTLSKESNTPEEAQLYQQNKYESTFVVTPPPVIFFKISVKKKAICCQSFC